MTIRRVGNVLLFLMITVVGWGQHTDPRTRTYIAPTRIVWQYNGSGGLIHNINALLKPGDGQGVLTNRNLCVLKSTGGEYPSFLIDFGKEIQGGLRMLPGVQKAKSR